jgi:hypothetical protein
MTSGSRKSNGQTKDPAASSGGRIIIPRSQLGEMLAEAHALQAQLQQLLALLETRYTGRSDRIGGWRHDPMGWAKNFPRR